MMTHLGVLTGRELFHEPRGAWSWRQHQFCFARAFVGNCELENQPIGQARTAAKPNIIQLGEVSLARPMNVDQVSFANQWRAALLCSYH